MSKAAISKSAKGYDRISRFYRVLEFLLLGRSLERARFALLPKLAQWAREGNVQLGNVTPSLDGEKRILVFGDGDGRMLEQLVFHFPEARFLSVDHSQKMLDLQRERTRKFGSSIDIQWLCCDALDFVPDYAGFDMIVMAFFLDCFSQKTLRHQLPTWLSGLGNNGILLFVDFVEPTSQFGRLVSAPVLMMMHRFFRWQTDLPNRQLVDLHEVLLRQDLEELVEYRIDHTLTSSRLYRIC